MKRLEQVEDVRNSFYWLRLGIQGRLCIWGRKANLAPPFPATHFYEQSLFDSYPMDMAAKEIEDEV